MLQIGFGKLLEVHYLTTSGVFTLMNLKVVNVKPPEDLKVFLAKLDIRLRSTVIIFPRVSIGCEFYSAFAKLRQATINFIMSVRPSA